MEITQENFMSHVVGKLMVAVSAVDGNISDEEIIHHANAIQQVAGVDLAQQQDFYNQIDGLTFEQIIVWATPEIAVLGGMEPQGQQAVIALLMMQALADGVEHPKEQAFIGAIVAFIAHKQNN